MDGPIDPASLWETDFMVPNMPALGTSLYYFLQVLEPVIFYGQCQQKRHGNSVPLAPRAVLNELFEKKLDEYRGYAYINPFIPEYKKFCFSIEIVLKFEQILIDVILSGMWTAKADAAWRNLDRGNPGQGLNEVTPEQQERAIYLLNQRRAFKRYCTHSNSWFLIYLLNCIENDTEFYDLDDSDNEGDDVETKEKKAAHRNTLRKNEFEEYQRDPEAYRHKLFKAEEAGQIVIDAREKAQRETADRMWAEQHERERVARDSAEQMAILTPGLGLHTHTFVLPNHIKAQSGVDDASLGAENNQDVEMDMGEEEYGGNVDGMDMMMDMD